MGNFPCDFHANTVSYGLPRDGIANVMVWKGENKSQDTDSKETLILMH